MELSYYKSMEPFWGAWRIKRLIGEGSFGKVFEIEREDFGRTYQAAMKVITIPQSESEFKSTLSDGMDLKSATSYYKSFVEEVVDEFAMMSGLKGNSNIVSYEDHTVIEHKDGVGWDILIRMELLTPLLELTSAGQFMERREVIKLGIDICKALEYCQKQNIIHRDIKPENIFVSAAGDYKLGDFGIARTVEKTTSGLSRKGTYTYMAPEVYKGEAYGVTVDIYSLGIVLYRLLNHNRPPFLPEFPTPITHSDRESSIAKRVGGDPIPLPAQAKDTLGEIVLKACSYLPEDRYRSPEEMRRDLESLDVIQSENPMADTAMLDEDVTVSIFGDTERTESPQNDFRDEDKTQTQAQTQASQDKALPPEEHKSKKNRPLLIGGIGAAAIAVAGIAFFLGKSSGNAPVVNEVHSDMAVAVDETDETDKPDDMSADSGEAGENTETEAESNEAEKDGELLADSEVGYFNELLYGSYEIQGGADAENIQRFLSDMQFEPNVFWDKELSILPVELEGESANQEYSGTIVSYSEENFYRDNRENQGKLFADMMYSIFSYEDLEKAESFYEENMAGKMDKLDLGLADRDGEWYHSSAYYAVTDGKLILYNPMINENEELELMAVEYSISRENYTLQISRDGLSVTLIPQEFSGNEYDEPSISGYASSPEDVYQDIYHIDIPAIPGDEAVVYFTDGKIANDPVVEFSDVNTATIRWESKRAMNESDSGNTVDEAGEVTFRYIPSPDVGFILIGSDGVYKYQKSYDQYFYFALGNNLDDSLVENSDIDSVDEVVLQQLLAVQSNIQREMTEAFEDRGINFTMGAGGTIILDSNILFGFDDAELSEEGKAYLDKFVDAYSSVLETERNKEYIDCILVEGYTDSAGNDDYNLELSERRAEAVKDYCTERDTLMALYLRAEGRGSANLIYDPNGYEKSASSRRVEFRIIYNT